MNETIYVVTNWDDNSEVNVFRDKIHAIGSMRKGCEKYNIGIPVQILGVDVRTSIPISAIDDSVFYKMSVETLNYIFDGYYSIAEAELK